MPTLQEEHWNALIDALKPHVDSVDNVPPDPAADEQFEDIEHRSGCRIPSSLRSLYSFTNGLTVPAYLPGRFDHPYLMFSLIPAAELTGWYQDMMNNDGSRGGLWRFMPHWINALALPANADGIWNRHWIPFATDGAAGVQFIGRHPLGSVYEYSPSTFGVRRIGWSLASYIRNAARGVSRGKIELLT